MGAVGAGRGGIWGGVTGHAAGLSVQRENASLGIRQEENPPPASSAQCFLLPGAEETAAAAARREICGVICTLGGLHGQMLSAGLLLQRPQAAPAPPVPGISPVLVSPRSQPPPRTEAEGGSSPPASLLAGIPTRGRTRRCRRTHPPPGGERPKKKARGWQISARLGVGTSCVREGLDQSNVGLPGGDSRRSHPSLALPGAPRRFRGRSGAPRAPPSPVSLPGARFHGGSPWQGSGTAATRRGARKEPGASCPTRGRDSAPGRAQPGNARCVGPTGWKPGTAGPRGHRGWAQGWAWPRGAAPVGTGLVTRWW